MDFQLPHKYEKVSATPDLFLFTYMFSSPGAEVNTTSVIFRYIIGPKAGTSSWIYIPYILQIFIVGYKVSIIRIKQF